MKKRTKSIIIAVIVVALIAGGGAAYGVLSANAAAAAKFSASYGTDVATTGNISLTVSGSGNLASSKTTTVAAASHLDIDSVLVSAGDTVQAGQPIAELDIEKMQVYADSIKTQIIADEDSLNTAVSSSSSGSGGIGSSSSSSSASSSAVTSFNITAPADGWIKSIKVSSSSSKNSIEKAMNAYGYLAIIATTKSELVSAAGSSLAEGDTVKVECQGHSYTGTVVIVNGGLYVKIKTVSRTIGADAAVYDAKGNTLFTGQIQLESYVPIVSNYGTIESRKVSENESVDAGDTLFEAEQYSLTVKNLYSDLQTLQAEYDAAQVLIAEGRLTAASSGIVDTLNLAGGQTYEEGRRCAHDACFPRQLDGDGIGG
jgi:multidrug efflux pump subunit AcrA (membrane-fusion protein)